MGVGLFQLLSHKFDRQLPALPAPSQSDREAPGAQWFHPRVHAWSFGTSQPRYYHPFLPYLGGGLTGPPEAAGVPPLLIEAGYHFGGELMTSHPG